MPMFDLRCDDCGEEFEELLSSSAEIEEVECPACGSEHVSRLLTGFAISGVGGFAGASAGSSGCSSSGPFR